MLHNLNLVDNGVLVILTAEAMKIGDQVVIKDLHHRQVAGLPPVDKNHLLKCDSFKAMVIKQIEDQLLAKELLREIYR